MFLVVARALLGGLLGCSGWLLGALLGGCYVVARLFWVVARWLLGCYGRLLGCYRWLLGRC